jgi:chromosome segregation ATPase
MDKTPNWDCRCGAIPCYTHPPTQYAQQIVNEIQHRLDRALDTISHLRDMNSRANDGIEELHKKISRLTNLSEHHEWVANKYKLQYEKVVAELELVKGAMNADDQRLRDAERRVFGDVTFGCDAPERMADEIEELRIQLNVVRNSNETVQDIQTKYE